MLFNPIRLLASGLITLVVLGFGGYRLFDGLNGAGDALREASATATDEGSMLRGSALGDALGEMKHKTGAKNPDALRITVYPSYVSAEMSTGRENRGQGYKITRKGDVTPFPLMLTGPGRLADNVFALGDLDPEALDRIVAGAARRDPSLGLGDVTHAIASIDPISGEAEWKVYFSGATYYTAKLDGSGLRAGAAPASAVSSTSSAADRALSDAKRVTDCLTKAAGDVAAVQACTK